MTNKFEEIFNSLPKERQEKILKRVDELLKEYWANVSQEWENEGGAIFPNNGKQWAEMSKEEKIDSIKKQMETTHKEYDSDNGC